MMYIKILYNNTPSFFLILSFTFELLFLSLLICILYNYKLKKSQVKSCYIHFNVRIININFSYFYHAQLKVLKIKILSRQV